MGCDECPGDGDACVDVHTIITHSKPFTAIMYLKPGYYPRMMLMMVVLMMVL